MRLAIYGYGKLGKATEMNAANFKDMEVVGVFSRREPATVKTLGAPVYRAQDILSFKDKIDMLFIAGGSATDLPQMTPELARNFNVIDSFDTHARIPSHFSAVDKVAKENGHIAMISSGWDPGMFSIARIYSQAVLPVGKTYTFWGKGVSQGHSDAIRRIDGVLDACQYTIPRSEALDAVRQGTNEDFTARQMHLRDCYVVAKEGAYLSYIENRIRTMPDYFADYDTTVHFVSMEEFRANHSGLPHGGSVIRSGVTGQNGEINNHTIEFKLQLDSNPQFTSSVILAFCRALMRMKAEGHTGCMTVFDIAPKYLMDISDEEMRAHLL